MPIYEYECTACCRVLEIFQRITENPVTTCPDCSGPVKKLMSKSSFQLKGGGWYADGYSTSSTNGSAGAAAAADTPNSSPDKSEKSSGDKADSRSSKEPVPAAAPKESSPNAT